MFHRMIDYWEVCFSFDSVFLHLHLHWNPPIFRRRNDNSLVEVQWRRRSCLLLVRCLSCAFYAVVWRWICGMVGIFVSGKMECCKKWIDIGKCSLWLVVDLCDEAWSAPTTTPWLHGDFVEDLWWLVQIRRWISYSCFCVSHGGLTVMQKHENLPKNHA